MFLACNCNGYVDLRPLGRTGKHGCRKSKTAAGQAAPLQIVPLRQLGPASSVAARKLRVYIQRWNTSIVLYAWTVPVYLASADIDRIEDNDLV